MGKILVGRDNPQEVEVGFTLANTESSVKEETVDEKSQEEAVDVVTEVSEPEAEQPSEVSEKAKAPVKGRGKKGRKA